MAKKITKKLKLQIPAGKANPAPPVGPALGQAGIAIGDFVTKFNDATKDRMGDIVPVQIFVYEDRSYDFVLKTPPASNLLMKAIGKDKASQKPGVSKAGTISENDLRAIAEKKMVDLNAHTVEQAMKIIAGTARSMGIEVK